MENTMEILLKHKIIAIVRRVAAEKTLPLAEALYEGGIRLIEVTFDQNDPDCVRVTANIIEQLSKRFGDVMCVGAGTVLNCEQLKAAAESGAKYILSPNVNTEVIKESVNMGVVAIPGAMTPTEIQYAWTLGASAVKLFPAGDMGLSYFKSLRGPLNHIPLVVTGGIDENNMLDYFNAGAIGAGIGSNITKGALINEGKFEELTTLAKKYTSRI